MPLNEARLVKPVQQLRKLARQLPELPSPEDVHRLRTNARQFEAAFHALHLKQTGLPRSLLKDVHELRRRAGRVRDLDVLAELTTALPDSIEPELRLHLLERLQHRRRQQAKKLRKKARHLAPRLRPRLKQAASQLERLTSPLAPRTRSQLTALAHRLALALTKPAALTPSKLHRYRLRLKRLQNVLLLAEVKHPSPFLRDLGAVKDAIGAWHDAALLLELAPQLAALPPASQLLRELAHLTEARYHHAVSLAQNLRLTHFAPAGSRLPGVHLLASIDALSH